MRAVRTLKNLCLAIGIFTSALQSAAVFEVEDDA